MHKRFVMMSAVAIGLAAGAGSAMAQLPLSAPKASFGIIGGLNVAKVGGKALSGEDVGNRTGFQGGLFLTLHLTNSFGIEPEVLYSQQGAKESDAGDDFTMKMDYIQVPVLLRFDLPSASAPIHPFLIAGPAASYQVKCGLGLSSGGTNESVSCDAANDLSGDDSFQKKSFDYAAVGGAGVSFGMGSKAVSVSARYTYGFNDTFQGSAIKNRYFSILAGLTF